MPLKLGSKYFPEKSFARLNASTHSGVVKSYVPWVSRVGQKLGFLGRTTFISARSAQRLSEAAGLPPSRMGVTLLDNSLSPMACHSA